MEHLRGLCEVLQLTIDEAAPGGQVSAITDTEAALLRIVRTLSDEQAQALLAVAHTMRRDGARAESGGTVARLTPRHFFCTNLSFPY